jgi:hypothetical protein
MLIDLVQKHDSNLQYKDQESRLKGILNTMNSMKKAKMLWIFYKIKRKDQEVKWQPIDK